jgi:hypothetical protein
MKRLTSGIAGGLAALAFAASAQGAVITYSASETGLPGFSGNSETIDLGSVFSSVVIDTSLGLTLSSTSSAMTLSAAGGAEGLQVVQGCAKAAAACGAADWFDIIGQGVSLGGTSLTQQTLPTEVDSFKALNATVTGISVESLRLRFGIDTSAPAGSSVGLTGSLSVAAVPEPAPWALLLCGVIAVAHMVRRKLA